MSWLKLLLKDIIEDGSNFGEQHIPMEGSSEEIHPVEMWIPGNPATFATRGEKPWKDLLAQTILPYDGRQMNGVSLHFYVQNLAPGGHPIDVDNLCEPVFSVLVNRLGWFGGKRPNIQWFYATKTQSPVSGLRLTLYPTQSLTVNLGLLKKQPIFEVIYRGILPLSATDPFLAEWVKKQSEAPTQAKEIAVLLRFGNHKLNLGDIATGRVKSVIDCMHPLIGGTPGRPDDWRIKTLAVDKGFPELGNNAVSITVWESARDEASSAKEESMLEKAIAIALQSHAGQKDKAGAPYILHPLRVMLSGETETEQICGVLHDVVEDSDVSLEDLQMEGFSDEVLRVVVLMTRKEHETYDEFVDWIMTDETAMKVKLADLKDNLDLTRIKEVTDSDRERLSKYEKAADRIQASLLI